MTTLDYLYASDEAYARAVAKQRNYEMERKKLEPIRAHEAYVIQYRLEGPK